MFKTIRASLPQAKKVRGYEIRRLPLGGYLQAVEAVKDAPRELMQAIFPGQSAAQILDGLRTIRPDGVQQLITRCMGAAPAILIRLLSALTGIPESKLLGDENIGLDGLAEILQAFLEINRIENFMKALKPLAEQMHAVFPTQTPGFSG